VNLSVVLCTFNRAETLRTALGSFAELHVPAGLTWELLVLDNNSTDHTRQVAEAAAARLPLRYLGAPRQGKSFALNAGIAEASGEVIAFTDDDATVDPEWLAALWRAFEQHDCIGVGGRIVPVWTSPKPRWYCETGPYRQMAGVIVRYEHGDAVREVEMLPFGANMAFRRTAFTTYGFFDTTLGPVGTRLVPGEDTEFCGRVRAGGGAILYVPDAIVYHPVEEARVRKSYFQGWYYRHGKIDVRLEPPPPGAIRWFGVPRYLFRDLLGELLRWVTAVDSRQRFYHKLACWRRLGQIAECRRLRGAASA